MPRISRIVIEYHDAQPLYVDGVEIAKMLEAEPAIREITEAIRIAKRFASYEAQP